MPEFFAGDTDKHIDVFIQDSSSTVGAGLSGLAYNTSGLKCYYRKGATGTVTQLTLATQTVGGAHSDGGFVELDATNMKGAYRLDLSDTIIASEGQVTLYLYGATNMAPCIVRLLVRSATRGACGTALPNAAADAAGGLPISDAGGLDLDNRMPAAAAVTNINTVFNTDFATNYDATNDVWVSRLAASGLQTDAVEEIRNAITGGAYALSTDASGMVRIVDGTGTGELNTSGGYIAGIAGTINTLDALDTAQGAQHSTTQAAISALNNLSAAQVNAEVDTALADINLDHLIKNAVDTDVPTTVHLNSVLGYVMDGGTAWSYDRTTDAMEVQGASHIVIDGNVSSIKTSTDAILLDTNELQTDWANGGRLDLIVDAILDDTGTAGVVVASDSKTEYSLASTGMDSVTLPANILTASALATDAVSEISAAVLTTAMTESYRGTGATATLAQACYEIIAHLGESAIVSTTKTLKKLDGTTAKTYTLDSATTPTSITETT